MKNDIKDFPLGVPSYVFSDLYRPEKLKDLHADFWKYAEEKSAGLGDRFGSLGSKKLKPQEESTVYVEVARHLGEFLGKLFLVSNHATRLKTEKTDLHPVFKFKAEFVHLRCHKRMDQEKPVDSDAFKIMDDRVKKIRGAEPVVAGMDSEGAVARVVCYLLECEKKLKAGAMTPVDQVRVQALTASIAGNSPTGKVAIALKYFEDWCVQAYVDPNRRKSMLANWVSILRPHKLEFEKLVSVEKPDPALPEKMFGPAEHLRQRDGFKLTDSRMAPKDVAREIDYCIYCHERDKDSCSKGFPEKTGGYKKNPLGIELKGCPLDERISEMHLLERDGETLAALAMVMLDNPMCPGTGHRICNDCMKGCIFQKQDPVNIPQNETRVLTDVLDLPYGFEIYSLLTRFNPLNRERPFALPYNGKDVLVVGLGPAGYTVAHYLANHGFGVVGIDGLKLEPVDAELTGMDRPFPKPVQHFSELKNDLDERILMGFGGVSEYGITVRWDKNFLSVIYLSLLRRQNLRVFGGVRFGGTLNLDDAWELGFSHVAIATGAGRPTIISMKNNLIKGIRKASDLLMALQLTGAFKKSSLANLQVKLPAVVIGGGLTAIDTATEIFAYYPVQVEKALDKFEVLTREFGEEKVWQMCDEEEKESLKVFLEHGKAVREERKAAEKAKRLPNLVKLVRGWGGVSLVYRKSLQDSPAYRLNHEEIVKALEEGIAFVENLGPLEAKKDKFGAVEAIVFERPNKEKVTIPARTVCVAAGTSPNTIYEREFPGSFKLDDKKQFFKKHVVENNSGNWKVREAKPSEEGAFFLSYENQGRFVSYYGDNHPDYAGNVVKAMASAKHGVPHVAKLFQKEIAAAEKKGFDQSKFQKLARKLEETLVPRVVRVDRLTPTIVEVIVKGHYIANKFEPGQFYRLQNYETYSQVVDGNRLQMEGIALTGAWVEKDKDLLSLIVLEMGGSSRLCSTLRPGDPVVVMGPTGTPSEIPRGKTVALVGGGLGNAVLLSIAYAMKKQGSRVIYFAGYKNPHDVFKQKEIEAGTDVVVWACDKAPGIEPRRPQDVKFVGNIIQAMESYASGKLRNPPPISLSEVDHMIVIGSDRMMAAVGAARHGVLKPYLKTDHMAIASINSPMQCMMKEVCAQCLQRHIDPKTGKEEYVFSCFNQDQNIDCVDFAHLNERLKANSLQEKLVNRQLDYLFQRGKVERA